MNRTYEQDKLQCSAFVKGTRIRCSRIGTHGNGKGVLCETHHKIYLQAKNPSKQSSKTVQTKELKSSS